MKAELTSRLAEANATPRMRAPSRPLYDANTGARHEHTEDQVHPAPPGDVEVVRVLRSGNEILSAKIAEIPMTTSHKPGMISRTANQAKPVTQVVGSSPAAIGPDRRARSSSNAPSTGALAHQREPARGFRIPSARVISTFIRACTSDTAVPTRPRRGAAPARRRRSQRRRHAVRRRRARSSRGVSTQWTSRRHQSTPRHHAAHRVEHHLSRRHEVADGGGAAWSCPRRRPTTYRAIHPRPAVSAARILPRAKPEGLPQDYAEGPLTW